MIKMPVAKSLFHTFLAVNTAESLYNEKLRCSSENTRQSEMLFAEISM